MPGDIDSDAQKLVNDLKDAKTSHNLSKVFEDIKEHSKDPNDLKAFISKANEDMQKDKVLPSLQLEGLDHKNVVFKDKNTGTLKEFDEHAHKVKEVPASKNDAAPPQQPEVHREVHGAHATVDRRGDLTEMNYANGTSQKFERDADGKINKFTDKGGTAWEKGKDDTWTSQQNPGDTWKGKVSTDRNGNFIKEDAGGKEIDRKDGSHLSYNKDGRLAIVTDGTGHATHFKYDQAGKVSGLERDDGSKVTTKDGGKTFSADDGKGHVTDGTNLQVDKFGSVSYDKGDKSGHRITEKNDGARLESDEKGRVVDMVTANKHEYSFKYDGDKLVGVKNDFGNWTSKDGHEFTSEKGEKWSGKVNVDDKGNYSFTSDDGRTRDYRTDGSNYTTEIRNPAQTRADDSNPGDRTTAPANQGDRPTTVVNPGDAHRDQGQQRPDAPAPRPFERAPDGSVIQEAPWGYHRQYQNGSSVDYDKGGHTIGTNDGQGHTRQFHYSPDGQVDWIKGFDGSSWMRTGPREFHDNYGRSYMGDVQVDQKGIAHFQPDALQDRYGRWHPHPPPFVQLPTPDADHGRRAELPGYRPQPPYRFGEYNGIVQPPPPQDTRQRQAAPVDQTRTPQPPADQTTQKPADQTNPPQKRTDKTTPHHEKPADTTAKPADTTTKPADTTTKPTDTTTKPADTTQKPSDSTTDQPKPPAPVEPTKVENFKPEGGIYNPVGPPGIGESGTGESFNDKRNTGKDNIPLAERYVDHHVQNKDGSSDYEYHGKLDDSTVWFDTKFTSKEHFTKDGQLTERHTTYDGGKDLNFKTDAGAQEIKGVTSVDTNLNPKTGNYETVIKNQDGQIYKTETGSDGKVKSFTKVTDDKQTNNKGDLNTTANNFKADLNDNYDVSNDRFNPVRPRGLGEFNPGQAKEYGASNRTSIAEKNSDNTTTYHYKGSVADGQMHWSNPSYEASENVDANGNVISTDIKYDRPTDEKFVGVDGKTIEVANVTQAHSRRNPDGSFATVITDKNGKMHTFKVAPNGKVLKVDTLETA